MKPGPALDHGRVDAGVQLVERAFLGIAYEAATRLGLYPPTVSGMVGGLLFEAASAGTPTGADPGDGRQIDDAHPGTRERLLVHGTQAQDSCHRALDPDLAGPRTAGVARDAVFAAEILGCRATDLVAGSQHLGEVAPAEQDQPTRPAPGRHARHAIRAPGHAQTARRRSDTTGYWHAGWPGRSAAASGPRAVGHASGATVRLRRQPVRSWARRPRPASALLASRCRRLRDRRLRGRGDRRRLRLLVLLRFLLGHHTLLEIAPWAAQLERQPG